MGDSGTWKLVAERNRIELFDLEKDLVKNRPCEKASKSSLELTANYNHWLGKWQTP